MKVYFFIFVASVINVTTAIGNGFHFGAWNQWTDCNQKGGGYAEQSRTRQCRTATCGGKNKELRPCKMPSCCTGTPWNEWSPCSVTCGTGEHRRHRSCEKNGKVCSEHDTITCILINCKTPDKDAKRYRTWSEWSPCNATCSHGITKRHRECLRDTNPDTCREHQSKSCYDKGCSKNSVDNKNPAWNAWGSWGACSKSCSGGRRSRTRTCQLDSRIQECTQEHILAICNEHQCGLKADKVIWNDWSNWSDCSTPCGPGNQRKTRTCNLGHSGSECAKGGQEFRGCNNPCKAQWGSWAPWSSCDATCGQGQALRNRQCLNERQTTTCFGNATQLQICVLKNCRTWPQWTKWSPWRECSSSCGPGEIIKTRLCMNGTAISNSCRGGHVRRVSCRGNCTVANNWSEWSGCSETCGTGFRRRTRICLAKRCVNPVGEENEECNTQQCGEENYSQCGIAGDVRQILTGRQVARVVRGYNAARGAWPWQVMIVNKAANIRESLKTEFLGGGGSLVNNKYVLSASHMLGKDENNYLIILGLTVIPRKNEEIPRHIQVYSVEKFETHEKFDKYDFDYDIALIKLGSRMLFNNNGTFLEVKSPSPHVSFSKYVRPICLPCIGAYEETKMYTIKYGVKMQVYEEENCDIEERKIISPKLGEGLAVVTGYGYITSRITNTEVSSRPEVLQQALLRMLDHRKCKEGVAKIVESIAWEAANYTTRMICTKSASTTVISDACQGDSGGPLVRQITREDGSTHWVQVGIVSWGLGCATTLEVPGSSARYQIPGYYTNVASLMAWITNILQI